MSLIKCSECGHEISSEAEMCPNCGCKTSVGKRKEENNISKTSGIIFYIVGTVMDVIGFVIIIRWYNNLSSWDRYRIEIGQSSGSDLLGLIIGIFFIIFGAIFDIIGSSYMKKAKNQISMPTSENPSQTYHEQWKGWRCPKCHIKNSEYTTKCKCGFLKTW